MAMISFASISRILKLSTTALIALKKSMTNISGKINKKNYILNGVPKFICIIFLIVAKCVNFNFMLSEYFAIS